jgi:hypothetical protein
MRRHRPVIHIKFHTSTVAALLCTALGWWLVAASSQAATQLNVLTLPTVSGTPQVGRTLTESHGTWSATPNLYVYQWEDCDAAGQRCTPISGASKQTYVVATSDLGDTLRVEETAFSWAGANDAISAATSVVSNPPVPTARSATTTSLISLEAAAVTNQIITLIATVTSSSLAAPPSGTLTFESDGTPIAGCQNKPVLATAQSTTLVCQTTFGAALQQLSAAFTPSSGSPVAASVSQPETLAVQPESTTTSLAVSNPVVHAHNTTTYTATVTPSYPGPLQPSQAVEFLDNGQPIPACASRPLASTGAASRATCTTAYGRPGQHLITARYVGDGSFAGSTSSPAELVDVVAGRIHPILSWTFYYSLRYTEILGLTVDHAPPGTRVLVSCAGHGCPFARRPIAVDGSAHATAGVVSLFRGSRLKPGTLIVVSVGRPGWIGKRYAFKVRKGHPPRLAISCQAPGMAPGAGC